MCGGSNRRLGRLRSAAVSGAHFGQLEGEYILSLVSFEESCEIAALPHTPSCHHYLGTIAWVSLRLSYPYSRLVPLAAYACSSQQLSIYALAFML